MTTQAMVSLTKDSKTFIKVIVGCDGYRAENVAKEIIQYVLLGGKDIEDIYKIAEEIEFGCKDCLVVMNNDDIIYKGNDELSFEKYKETFEDPQFNPRWEHGTTEYLYIIPML